MKVAPLLERRSPLGISYALLILAVFFFFLPSGFRAARLSLGQKENDVKDWLPSDFPETAELEWFAKHFIGESFVLATWEGCTSDDQRLKLFEQKLLHESDTYDPSAELPPKLAEAYQRAKQIGNELKLLPSGNMFLNWGGRQEKWLNTPSGKWYFLTPDGRLYRWDEASNGPSALVRSIKKALGSYELKGQLVTAFGEEPAPGATNPFYNDPTMVTASLFHTVQTGDSIVATLAREGGPLWPIDLTDESRRETVARRRAMERLTGTLFAPAVPNEFDWTPQAFRNAVPEKDRLTLPEDFDTIVQQSVDQIVDEFYNGSLEQLQQATLDEQTAAWYSVFDTADVPPPPRLTAVLVTLTDLAKNNLPYALGRGVLGQPRGRLLQLAEESGVRPAPAPSLAPPPFNRMAQETVDGMPALRMGGPPVDNMAIDEEGTVTLVRLVGYSIAVGIVLSYLCFSSIKITIMVFVVGGTSAMLSMAMVWWSGGRVDAILMSMPSLVYVLGLSGAIHVVNYYRDEVRSKGQRGAAGRALRHALLPCTLASVTTAIGLISLFTSNLAPISNFGLYAAIGVIVTLGILFSYLPAALQTFTPHVTGADQTPQPGQPRVEGRLSDWWAGVGRWITSHHVLVSTGCIVALLLCAIGMRNIKTSVQLLKLFDPDSRIIHDYAWLEENFGKLVPMELIVRIPPPMQSDVDLADTDLDVADDQTDVDSLLALDMLRRVETVSRIRTVVHRTLGEPGLDVVGQAMSADTFLPPLPAPSNSYNPIRAKFTRELLAARDELRTNDYLRIEKQGPFAGSELWRISLRVAALSDVDYGQFITTLRTAVEPVLRAYDTRDELLRQLTSNNDGKIPARSRVLILGSERPGTLQQMQLVGDDGETILTRNTYLATLGELLAGDRIERPDWVSVTAEKAAEMTASDSWEKFLDRYDAVVLLSGASFEPSDFQSVEHLVDARTIEAKTVAPVLQPGQIPDVEGSGPIQVVYTGVIPVVYKAQRTLLSSLANSIAMAFVLIAMVMVLLLNPGRPPFGWFSLGNFGNGLAAGAVAMIPNIFPVLVVFGLMCHWGIEIDIGTMMTASVAMGVAVDDTIHFLSWFRENLDRGMSRIEAVIETYRRVGPAMTQTTVVGGLGLFVFALSTFTPTQRFGILMLVMLGTALIGDLILLPALLAGPLGRWFKPRLDASGRPIKLDATPTPIEPAAEVDRDREPRVPIASEPQAAAATGSSPPHLRVHFPTERTDPPHRIKKK